MAADTVLKAREDAQEKYKSQVSDLRGSRLDSFDQNKFNVKDNSRHVWSKLGSLENYGACGGAILTFVRYSWWWW
jgi:hypothetical protein